MLTEKESAMLEQVNREQNKANHFVNITEETLAEMVEKGESKMQFGYYELKPTTQKSFYGKAIVEIAGSTKLLYSYETKVCTLTGKGNFFRNWHGYSATTMKHVNAFREANNLPAIGKKQWEAMPVKY